MNEDQSRGDREGGFDSMVEAKNACPMIVRPYCGVRYGIDMPFGLSILVLGESAYDCDCGTDGSLVDNLSELIIGHVFNNERAPSINKAASVFYGGRQNAEQRQDFWRTAAFTNYVQHNVGAVPRERPTNDQWEYAHAAFQQTLDEVKPQFVLVLGKELWSREFQRDECATQIMSIGAKTKPFCLRRHRSGSSFIFGINHPSSPGWAYAKWSPWVTVALDEARCLHDRQG